MTVPIFEIDNKTIEAMLEKKLDHVHVDRSTPYSNKQRLVLLTFCSISQSGCELDRRAACLCFLDFEEDRFIFDSRLILWEEEDEK